MTTVYKILGQSLPAPNTWTTVYTVPNGNSAIISSIAICNISNSLNARYGLCVTKSGTGAPASNVSNTIIVSEATVLSSDTAFLTLGLTLGANDSVRANVMSGNVAINLFGTEIY